MQIYNREVLIDTEYFKDSVGGYFLIALIDHRNAVSHDLSLLFKFKNSSLLEPLQKAIGHARGVSYSAID
jgi:hypothetical protein